MKRILAVFLCLCAILSAIPAARAQPDLPLSCSSALLMEKESGNVLWENNAHERMEPASVTKIMTLLLVMEALDAGRIRLDDRVTVSANAAGMGGSQVYLKQGEQMSVEELIKCVTVVSGNDCAVALAEYLSGSEQTFVETMNQRAAELGMNDTIFRNCTGLPASGHLTTAYDIALMSRELILNHPDIRNYTTVWMDSIRDGAFGLTNTNRLVRFYPGATGLKTGSTDSALYCISATAQRDGMELIAVVMHAPTSAQRFEDAQRLLDYGFAGYAMADVYPDAPLAPVAVVLGQQAQVQPQLERSCRILVEKGQLKQLSTRMTLCEAVEAPVEEGQILGQLEVFMGEQPYENIPIVAAHSVQRLSVGDIFRVLLRGILMHS